MNSQPATSGFLDVAGGRLAYEVAGSGHPLLLIHAAVADMRMWESEFAFFAQSYRVIRYDTRGFGQTTSADGPCSDMHDIADLLQHLGVTRTAVVGLSNGGRLAIDFTLAHPELVDALVAVAPGISGHEGPATEVKLRIFAEYERLKTLQDRADLTNLAVHVWCDGPMQPEGRAATQVRDRVREMITNNARLHLEQLQRQPLAPPAEQRLGEIQVPTLGIVGDLDFSDALEAIAFLTAQVQGAQQVIFPNTAHMVNMEQPERFQQVVAAFLAGAV